MTRRGMIARAGLLVGCLASASAQVPVSEWKSADPGYRIELPQDHASHPDYRLEWWYYTGNVAAPDGRRFGFQVTFFRVGVDPRPENPSRWAVRDVFIAHLAVADLQAQRFRFTDLINRAGVGWAGAAVDRYEVWNERWRVTLDAEGRHVLTARAPAFGLELRLDPGKPWVRQGQNGYSQKGRQRGNASHYYSLTRMPTAGRLFLDDQVYDVVGESWMDHEFGSTFLEPGQRGWDWFSLQLDNGSELMLYRFRRSDGGLDPYSTGAIIDRQGRVERLTSNQFALRPGRTWSSTATGASYPIEWVVEIPARRISLAVRAALPDQELRTGRSTGVSYWEGSVTAEGQWQNSGVRGTGYLEMTGYSGRPMSEVMR